MIENEKPFDARTATEAERKQKLAEINRKPVVKPDEGFHTSTATPAEIEAQARKLGFRIRKNH
jgi:hypothetical protein